MTPAQYVGIIFRHNERNARSEEDEHGHRPVGRPVDGKAKAKKEAGEDVGAFIAEKEQEYNDLFANPYQAAKYGYIDDVIEPRNTRFRICRALAQLQTKRDALPAKKHGNIPM